MLVCKGVTTMYRCPEVTILAVRVRVRFVFMNLGLGLDLFFDTNSMWGSNLVDGDGDFESVPSDQLCRSGKRD